MATTGGTWDFPVIADGGDQLLFRPKADICTSDRTASSDS
jgi:hypothetical protein